MEVGMKALLWIMLGTASTLWAAESSEPVLDVYENYGDFVLVEKNKVTRFVTPQSLHANGNFSIRIKRAPAPETVKKEITQADRIEARKLMYSANQAFFAGNFEKAWELVEQAEVKDPSFFRIKSMKASLLYRIGSKDLAVALWQESLSLNPDQPEIIEILNKTARELGETEKALLQADKSQVPAATTATKSVDSSAAPSDKPAPDKEVIR